MRKIFKLNNKGMTLVELVVSMALFTVVLTLTVGFFIAIQKLQSQYRQTANMQDEGRFAAETFSRITREAKTVQLTNSSGASIDFSGGIDLCATGDTLNLTMMDGTVVRFDCKKDSTDINHPSLNHLRMDSGLGAYNLTTDQVNVDNFMISRGAQATYPKTLKYQMQIEETNLPSGEASASSGEKMDFEDYLIMHNEL